jgi:hypothetical protein
MPFEASTRTSGVCAAIPCENRRTHASATAAIEFFRILNFPLIVLG